MGGNIIVGDMACQGDYICTAIGAHSFNIEISSNQCSGTCDKKGDVCTGSPCYSCNYSTGVDVLIDEDTIDCWWWL